MGGWFEIGRKKTQENLFISIYQTIRSINKNVGKTQMLELMFGGIFSRCCFLSHTFFSVVFTVVLFAFHPSLFIFSISRIHSTSRYVRFGYLLLFRDQGSELAPIAKRVFPCLFFFVSSNRMSRNKHVHPLR